MDRSESAELDLSAFFADEEDLERLDGAFLLTPTGSVLAGWNREPLRQEVLTVMSATLTASVDVLLEEIRGRRPRLVLVEADRHRFLVARTRSDDVLVLFPRAGVPKRSLLASARGFLARLARSPSPGDRGREVLKERT